MVYDLVQLIFQGLDPREERAAKAEGARDEAGLKVHGPEAGGQVVIPTFLTQLQPISRIYVCGTDFEKLD